MVKVNNNFLKLQDSYLFSTIAKNVKAYQKEHPDKKIIKLGIGDVTLPIPNSIKLAMEKAIEEMNHKETFRGYGPEQGYEFLREKIIKYDYQKRNIEIDISEVFVSDGAKCDTGNIVDLFDADNIVAISDPVYPVYLDTNVISGRSGEYIQNRGIYENIEYMKLTQENNFEIHPKDLSRRVDLIYICSPNNPTGTVLNKDILKEWVEYAKQNNSIILYDAAYEAYIQEENIPHSIYEIEDARKVAIEFKSFSKTAGFTGLRCAYTIIPKELNIKGVSLNDLWKRRQCTKFNGVSYVTQRGAEAVYSEEGMKEIRENIKYYQDNAEIIKKGLDDAKIDHVGGINAPYIWLKVPNNIKSWDYFDMLLQKANIVGTPGVGFGPSGEGYFRLTAFGDRENTIEAMRRIKEL